jgi:chromosome segregation ATPase
MPDSNKKDHRKDILERHTATQDKSGKQVKIDEMMAPKESQPDLKKLMDIVTRLEKKVNNLVSKEYIENALDERLEGLVSEKFVAFSLKTLKKGISDDIKADLDKVYVQIRSVKSKIKEAHTEIEYLKHSESDMKVEIQKVNEEN